MMTMICEATLWPEIKLFHKSHPDRLSAALAFDHKWLYCYPRPLAMVYGNVVEFIRSEFQELLQSYHIKVAPTTAQNPQVNGCLERMHLTLADKLRTMEVDLEDCPIEINWAINTMLRAAAWGLKATISTVSKTSPGGVVFERDTNLISE